MTLSARDQAIVWHPYTQMHTAPAPLPVVSGQGAHLTLEDGRVLIDAVSSWWVTVHGHAHPYIAKAIGEQAAVLEQVIFAGCTHPQAVRLAELLIAKLPASQRRVFFTDNGSTAVEVALKMAWQYWQNRGESRSRLLALEDAYHGDTFGAMSLSGRSVFTAAFDELLFDVGFLPNPADAPEACLRALEQACAAGDVASLIVEPLVQGAGGMKMYSPGLLEDIQRICRQYGVLLIFDEVMTGFYRTGKLFAAGHGELEPDIVCLSKGLTGGFMPMAITTCTQEIYAAFLSDDKARMLFHGHSYTANALGCAAANASLDLFDTPELQAHIDALSATQAAQAKLYPGLPGVSNVRVTGTIFAFDLVDSAAGGYLNQAGWKLADALLARGVMIRPLGNVVYIMPPYAISVQELEHIHEMLREELARISAP